MARSKKKVVDLLANIPEGTRWLIDFVNLGLKEQGEYNPYIAGYPEKKRMPKIGKLIPDAYLNSRGLALDNKGNVWGGTKQKPQFFGTKDHFYERENFPLQEFKEWILKVGIPPYKPEKITVTELDVVNSSRNSYELNLKVEAQEDKKIKEVLADWQNMIRYTMHLFFEYKRYKKNRGDYFCLIQNSAPLLEGLPDYTLVLPRVNWAAYWPDKKVEFKYGAALPEAALAYLLEFWVNRKDLLRGQILLCPTCGRFFFKSPEQIKYCCRECQKAFNTETREQNLRSQQTSRKEKKKKKLQEENEEAAAFERAMQEEQDKKKKDWEDRLRAVGTSPKEIKIIIDKCMNLGLTLKKYLAKHRPQLHLKIYGYIPPA